MTGGADVSPTASPDAPRPDLRSDTVTRPDEGMRRAMYDAEVGDDVYGEDPCVNRLEETVAERLGKEAALFVASGTMGNLTALLAHCGRGEEVIAGRGYHVSAYEAAGASVLGGISICTVPVEADGGLSPDRISAEVRPNDNHLPVSRLVSLENTHDGKAVPLARFSVAAGAAQAAGLSVHLDGARFFNAVTALGCAERDLSDPVDTVSLCLSKGLGTPAGSVLAGSSSLIERARRYRKMLGGGMRQSGILAAAGLHALEHNVERLADDHVRAKRLAAVLEEASAGTVVQSTNMVFLTPRDRQNDAFRAHMAARGVLVGGGATGAIRMVLHKDIDDQALDVVLAGMHSFLGDCPGRRTASREEAEPCAREALTSG